MLPTGISTKLEQAGFIYDPAKKELSLSPPKTQSPLAASVSEDALDSISYRGAKDKAEWVAKWQKVYGEWRNVMDEIVGIYELKKEEGRPKNALKLVAIYERLSASTSKEDYAAFMFLENMRRIVREAEWLQRKGAFGQDKEYMQRQGYAQAYNMATFGMCLDAANAKRIKGENDIVLDNFGAIFLMLINIDDRGHTDLMRQYKDNKDAFPEKDANEVLESARDYIVNVAFSKTVSVPKHLERRVAQVMALILESTPQ